MATLHQNQKLDSRKTKPPQKPSASQAARRCRDKFLRFFPKGFDDPKYIAWERGYKWNAHLQWKEELGRGTFQKLLREEKFAEICARAVRIEARTNLLFSFEKMALRDALKTAEGAQRFAEGLFEFLHGRAKLETRFNCWCRALESLPRKGRRVLTHPVATVFGFIAEPETHIFLKPMVTRRAAAAYGVELFYESRPSWKTYTGFLEFAEILRRDLTDLKPRDLIDLQSFMWVQGSDEYAE